MHSTDHQSSCHPALSPVTFPREVMSKERGLMAAKNISGWVDLLFSFTDVMVVDFFSVFEQFGISKVLSFSPSLLFFFVSLFFNSSFSLSYVYL